MVENRLGKLCRQIPPTLSLSPQKKSPFLVTHPKVTNVSASGWQVLNNQRNKEDFWGYQVPPAGRKYYCTL